MSGQYWRYHLSVDELEKISQQPDHPNVWLLTESLETLRTTIKSEHYVDRRRKAMRTIETAVQCHPLLTQFAHREQGKHDEIVFDPDAEFPVRIELRPPEFDLAGNAPQIPKRFLGHGHNAERGFGHLVAKITGTIYLCRHPDLPRLQSGRYLLSADAPHGPYAHISWENSNGGRYKVFFECRLDKISWQLSHTLIYRLMLVLMNNTPGDGILDS